MHDDRSGFTHYNTELTREFGLRWIARDKVDPIDYTYDTAIDPSKLNYCSRFLNTPIYVNKLGEEYVNNDPPGT